MSVNCRGLKGTNKQLDLIELAEEHKPDIICGTQSHLDKNFSNSVFPPGYDVEREDRDCHGGGVFIAVHNDLLASPKLDSLKSNCEVLWRKIDIQGTKPLYIGNYYRATDRNISSVTELNESLKKIPHSVQPTQHILDR